MTKKITKPSPTAKKPKAEAPLTAVDLAKDLLLLLKAKKFRLASAGSVGFDNDVVGRHYLSFSQSVCETFQGQSLQKIMKLKKFKPCTGCAMGGLLMAFVDKRNQLDIPNNPGQYQGDDEMILRRLMPIISERQLWLIEYAYEQGATSIYAKPSNDLDRLWINAAFQFGKSFPKPEPRLRAILQNMIKNHGYFMPPILTAVFDGPLDMEDQEE